MVRDKRRANKPARFLAAAVLGIAWSGIGLYGSAAAAAEVVQTRTVKVGYFNLALLKSSCDELATVDVVKSQGERQLADDLDASQKIMAQMLAENKNIDEIDGVRKQLQESLDSEVSSLKRAFDAANQKAQQRVRNAIAAVIQETGLDVVTDRVNIFGRADQLNQAQDVTALVAAHLRSIAPAASIDVNGNSLRKTLTGSVAQTNTLVLAHSVFNEREFSAAQLDALSQNGIGFGPNSSGDHLDLIQGGVLFAPKDDIQINIGEATVSISAGAAAWIVSGAGDVSVYSLHDGLTTGRVQLNCKHHQLRLMPGMHVLVTRKQNETFLNGTTDPATGVDCHKVKELDCSDGLRILITNFSISQSLGCIPIMADILQSSESQHKKLVGKLVKNAAIQACMNGYH